MIGITSNYRDLSRRECHGFHAVFPDANLPPACREPGRMEAHPSFDPVRHLTIPDPGPRPRRQCGRPSKRDPQRMLEPSVLPPLPGLATSGQDISFVSALRPPLRPWVAPRNGSHGWGTLYGVIRPAHAPSPITVQPQSLSWLVGWKSRRWEMPSSPI